MFDKLKASQMSKSEQRELKGGAVATGPYKAARDQAYASKTTTEGDNEGDLGPDNGPNGGA